MTDRTIGPWPLGIDNRSRDTAIPDGSLRSAVNVLIDTDGSIESAQMPRLAVPLTGAHSLWTSASGESYCVHGSNLCRATISGLQTVAQLAGPDPVSFCDLNGKVIFSSRLQIAAVDGDGLADIALPTPSIIARAINRGGLNPGRYGVAISLRKGMDESGTSSMLMLDVPAGGGIEIDMPAADADAVSVYRTDANGGELYRAVDGPVGMAGYLVGVGALGAMPATRFLEPLPGGHIVAAWMGRLLVARGRNLIYSSPLRYGLHNPTTNFVQFASQLRMVLPVNDGVYLADSKHCYFLKGTAPEAWQVITLESAPPPAGAGFVLDGSNFDQIPAVPVACWISEKGFALGLPDGQVVLAQEKRLRLPMPDRAWLVTDGRRLFTGS